MEQDKDQNQMINDEFEIMDDYGFPPADYYKVHKDPQVMSRPELIKKIDFLIIRNRDLSLALYDNRELLDEKEVMIDHYREQKNQLNDKILDLEKLIEENQKIIDDLNEKIDKKNQLIIRLKKNTNTSKSSKK